MNLSKFDGYFYPSIMQAEECSDSHKCGSYKTYTKKFKQEAGSMMDASGRPAAEIVWSWEPDKTSSTKGMSICKTRITGSSIPIYNAILISKKKAVPEGGGGTKL